MKKLFLMMSVLLSTGLFCACSNDGDEEINGNGGIISCGDGDSSDEGSTKNFTETNMLYIQSDNGSTEKCLLDQPSCAYTFGGDLTEEDGSIRHIYNFVFWSLIQNSSPFYSVNLSFSSSKMTNFNDLKVGDYFDSSVITFYTVSDIPQNTTGTGYFAMVPPPLQSGQVLVVDKKTINNKSYITLSLQNLKIHSDQNDCDYTFNALVDFEIDPNCCTPDVDMEELLIPTDNLVFFMLDALNNEYQGRHTFFSDGSEKQECLIINSLQEFKDAYKGAWNLCSYVDFRHCTLVIGRTYGENGGVSLGDYDIVDNGDSYQLNLTLNNNVNPNYTYTPAVKNLYFWKIYPKMENKPVVFNRITQDVDIDPLGDESAYEKIRNRWYLSSYIDANGTSHHVDGDWGNERYSIEFKENGMVEGRIGENIFSCYYMLPYTPKIKPNDENNYRDDLTYGVINLWGWNVTENNDDDPLSKHFMRIFNATQFKLWSSNLLVLRLSEREVFGFMRENLKKDYGYK